MNFEKENFLRTKLITHLQQLDPSTPPKWGKLNVQGMIEHFAHDAVRNASGKLKFEKTVTSGENLQRMRDFMLSDKPFRPNTKNPLMQEEPIPLHYKTVQAAINSLQQELIDFFNAYEKEPSLTIINPFFGSMNFDQNVQLLYKHALHHLNQFGVEPSNT